MGPTLSNKVSITIYKRDIDSIRLSIPIKKSFQQEVHSNRPIMKRTFQRVCHSNGPPVPTTNQPTCKNYPAYCARCLVKGKGYYQYNWSRIPYLKPCIIEFNRCTAKLIETAELNRSNEKELRYRYL